MLCTGVYLYYTCECMFQKKSSGLALSLLTPKIELSCIKTCHQTVEINPLISYSGKLPLKVCFSNGPYMIACFHEHLALELSKLVHRAKIMQIPNMTVNLFAEDILTMNL